MTSTLTAEETETVARIAAAVTDGTLPEWLTLGRLVFHPSSPLFASWALNTAERLAEAEAQANPYLGQAATIGSGSDSYAAVITDVVRFKSGRRAGQVRSVTAAWITYDPEAVVVSRQTGGYGSDQTVDVTHPSVRVTGHRETFTAREQYGRIVWRKQGCSWGSLYLGAARDYRDPHF